MGRKKKDRSEEAAAVADFFGGDIDWLDDEDSIDTGSLPDLALSGTKLSGLQKAQPSNDMAPSRFGQPKPGSTGILRTVFPASTVTSRISSLLPVDTLIQYFPTGIFGLI